MLSIPDMALLGAAALLLFGPDQLPRVARKAGNVMREIQSTSQHFIREMERAADVGEADEKKPYEPAPYDPSPYDSAASYDAVHTNGTSFAGVEPAEPDPEWQPPVAEKLADPRPAPGLDAPGYVHGAEPFDPPPRKERSSPDRLPTD
ncbi:MAG: hypothetical protein NVS3B7_12300 [Candidatus Elarobacter sp.]